VASKAQDPGRAEYFEDATDDLSPSVEWTMPDSRYVDAAALLVLTTASLRAAESVHPAGSWDPRRFRPNVLVDLDDVGWAEDAWIGQVVQLGTAAIVPTQGCVRCTMVTREQPGLDEDRDVFRALARHHRGRFGVWCDVLAPGSVEVGSRLLVPATEPAARRG
jgi:uncharacterized protein YcbX